MMLDDTLRKEQVMASIPTPVRPRTHHGEKWWGTRWYDDLGKRRGKWFGKVAKVTERQAGQKFKMWLAKWHGEDRVKNPQATQHTYGVKDMAVDYLAHARKTFVKHGRMTSHVWEVAYAMQHLLDAFDGRAASGVEAPDLAALRDSMIFGRNGKADDVRTAKTVNNRLGIIKQAYGWAREKGLVTREAMADVMIVKPLVEGRSAAAKSKKIIGVDEHWVAVAKEHCTCTLAAMIDLQWLTGMRPGEVCIMRATDIDRDGDVWLYYPSEHKTEHKGKQRIVPLGPQSQAIIEKFIARPTDAYLFSPAESEAERAAKRRANCKPQKYPSWYREQVKNATGRLASVYLEETYRKAIHHACLKSHPFPGHASPKAFRQMAETKKVLYRAERLAWKQSHTWNPNQLRHSAATRLNKLFSLEDVSVNLGHADLRTTRIYAVPDVSRACEIARKVG